jgi:hypothetical protein
MIITHLLSCCLLPIHQQRFEHAALEEPPSDRAVSPQLSCPLCLARRPQAHELNKLSQNDLSNSLAEQVSACSGARVSVSKDCENEWQEKATSAAGRALIDATPNASDAECWQLSPSAPAPASHCCSPPAGLSSASSRKRASSVV